MTQGVYWKYFSAASGQYSKLSNFLIRNASLESHLWRAWISTILVFLSKYGANGLMQFTQYNTFSTSRNEKITTDTIHLYKIFKFGNQNKIFFGHFLIVVRFSWPKYCKQNEGWQVFYTCSCVITFCWDNDTLNIQAFEKRRNNNSTDQK